MISTRYASLLLLAACTGCQTPSDTALRYEAASMAAERLGAGVDYSPATAGAGDRGAEQAEVRRMLRGDLDEAAAVKIALLCSPALAAGYDSLGIERSRLLQAGRAPNPELDASVRFSDGRGEVVDMTAVQDLVAFILIPRRVQSARSRVEAAKLRLAGQVLHVAVEARKAFVDCQTDARLLSHARTLAEISGAALDVAERMRNAGTMTELDAAAYRMRYGQALSEAALMEQRAREQREKLIRVMGLEEDSGWKLAENASTAPPPSGEKCDSKAIEASLEIRAMRLDIEALLRRKGIVQVKSYLPELLAGVDSEHERDGIWTVGPALVLRVPAFDQGQAERAVIDAEIRRGWNDYAAKVVEVASSARSAASRAETGWKVLNEYQEKIVAAAREATAESLRYYNGMLIGVFDLLAAKDRETRAAMRREELSGSYRKARAELQHLLNGGSLVPPVPGEISLAGEQDRDEGRAVIR